MMGRSSSTKVIVLLLAFIVCVISKTEINFFFKGDDGGSFQINDDDDGSHINGHIGGGCENNVDSSDDFDNDFDDCAKNKSLWLAELNVLGDFTVSYYHDIFADDIDWITYGLGEWQGFQPTYDYLHLGGPDSELIVAEAFEEQDFALNGNILFTAFTFVWHAPLAPQFGTLRTRAAQRMVFDNSCRIAKMEWWNDPSGLSVFYSGLLTLASNITAVCELIQSECTASLVQYPSVANCTTFLESIRFVDPDGVPRFYGNSAVCRAIHSQLAKTNPTVHCPHTGTQKIDLFHTPCQDFP